MSVTSHLKDLLSKMGGTPKNGDSTSVLIDKIEDVYDSGSGGGSGGNSGVMVVIVYADTANDVANTAGGVEVQFKTNKTPAEIMAAYDNNMPVVFVLDTLKKFDNSVFEDSGLDTENIHTWFLPRTINSEHLDTLGHVEQKGISILSSRIASEYAGGNTDFGYYSERLTLSSFSCEQIDDSQYCCMFDFLVTGRPPYFDDLFGNGFYSDGPNDLPTTAIYFNTGEF